ncbi:MAG: hypothetical protein HN617_09295 [Planctomycetaceae bacterium]|nr:hypothetical protein [Planctomycetaceae bacterium]MBT4013917.1 hypothetical protein [Planctomycetaceae bacterium]MBT4724023.1 hypothetical protein [Planctomycetaceae bacterium]MBT4844834.1 hypothetical protein [Planctomycetaceae bacterium]MBT5126525.1 hypothetical protein [Planctomycetaceae bacterium]
MFKRTFFQALTLALLIAPLASAQIIIKPRVEAPGSFETNLHFKVKQTLSVMGQDIDTASMRKVTAKTDVSKPDSAGNVTYSSKYTAFENKISLPGGVELEFDSNGENTPQGTQLDFILPLLEALSKSTTTIVHNKNGDIVKMEVDAEGLDALDAQAKAMLGGELDGDILKEKAQNQIDEFNDKPVNIGDSWKSETTLELGQGTVFEMTSSQKYLGTIQQDGKTLHHVEIKYTEVDFEQPAATPGAAAVTESDLEIIEGTSTLLFDAEKGRIVTSKIHLEVKGEITLTIADMDLPAKLALEITINQTNK